MQSTNFSSLSDRILLISMPFGPLYTPSMGLSLLSAGLKSKNVEVRTIYFTIDFAELIGDPLYMYFSNGFPATEVLIGEWLFSSNSSTKNSDLDQLYLDKIFKPRLKNSDKPEGLKDITDEKLIELILKTRSMVPKFLDFCSQQILEASPKVVGFTSTFQQHCASLALARNLKEHNPSIQVLMGGANCEGAMGLETVKQFSFIDAIVSGEGDVVVPRLVSRIFKGSDYDDLPGVITQTNKVELATQDSIRNAASVLNMDSLPYPTYEDYFSQWKTKRAVHAELLPGILFETSRGCWWGQKSHCTFCGLNGGNMSYRSKSAERALTELLYLTKRYPESSVSVVDNILDMKYFKTFLPMLAEREERFDLFYEVKANLKKEQVKLLQEAGVKEIQPGIESFSNNVLKLMRKGVSGLQNIQLLKWCAEFGIDVSWNILYGFPGESEGDYSAQAHLIPLLTHLNPPFVCTPIRLDRFSPNFDSDKELGFKNVTPVQAYEFIYPELSNDSLHNIAYYFSYSYFTDKDLNYTLDLRKAVREWRKASESSKPILAYTDSGLHLIIFDSRPVAEKSAFTVSGISREIFLYCDQIRSVKQVHRHISQIFGQVDILDIQSTLERFIENKLMICEETMFLSLAIRVEEEATEELKTLLHSQTIFVSQSQPAHAYTQE